MTLRTLTFAALFVTAIHGGQHHTAATTSNPVQRFGQFPLSFERNIGQLPLTTYFVARGPGYSVSLSPSGANVTLERGGTLSLDEIDPKPRRMRGTVARHHEPPPFLGFARLHRYPELLTRIDRIVSTQATQEY